MRAAYVQPDNTSARYRALAVRGGATATWADSYSHCVAAPTDPAPGMEQPVAHSPAIRTTGGSMLYYAIVFLVIALIAALFGFSGIAASAAGIAKILFFVFLIFAAISFILQLTRRRS
jgi:uncharacterized membrane protein YtjA (UPF0391 family)